MKMQLTRRRFLAFIPPALGALLLAACGGSDDEEAASQAGGTSGSVEPTHHPEIESGKGNVTQLTPTPACGDDDEPTLAQTEGPFFTPDSPKRTSLLEAGIAGTPLLVTGFVLNTSCEPIENALVDFWHTDAAGGYDNVWFKLRGHQFTDGTGAYRLETIVPGLYPARTRHIHVKVQAPGQPVLTTQLYFPDEPRNASDGIFDPALLIEMGDTDATQIGSFRFVLDV